MVLLQRDLPTELWVPIVESAMGQVAHGRPDERKTEETNQQAVPSFPSWKKSGPYDSLFHLSMVDKFAFQSVLLAARNHFQLQQQLEQDSGPAFFELVDVFNRQNENNSDQFPKTYSLGRSPTMTLQLTTYLNGMHPYLSFFQDSADKAYRRLANVNSNIQSLDISFRDLMVADYYRPRRFPPLQLFVCLKSVTLRHFHVPEIGAYQELSRAFLPDLEYLHVFDQEMTREKLVAIAGAVSLNDKLNTVVLFDPYAFYPPDISAVSLAWGPSFRWSGSIDSSSEKYSRPTTTFTAVVDSANGSEQRKIQVIL